MRWQVTAPQWKRRFALLPIKIGDNVLWLEWFERRWAGEYYEVRELPQ